jgi:hypothetical protein
MFVVFKVCYLLFDIWDFPAYLLFFIWNFTICYLLFGAFVRAYVANEASQCAPAYSPESILS